MTVLNSIRAKGVNLYILTTCILIMAVSALANIPSQPVFNPEVAVTKSDDAINVDGDLSDGAWANAVTINNFVERFPGDNTAPEVATRTYVTYDDKNLYVAFVCLDDPSSLRATMCQRDQFNNNDAIRVLIDTYGDASWAYEFMVNPYGVQRDNLWSTTNGSDASFDLIWESSAKITDSGYQVEMAVPFSSMRFPDRDVQDWKMDFWRDRPRESFSQYSWAAYDRSEQCWPCQWGTVQGLGDVEGGKGLELLPTYVAHESGQLSDFSNPDSDFKTGDIMGELSLGAKYTIGSDITAEASYNPDFSQIESDAAQVDVNTTIALLFPERRPFFQEGSDVFRTLFNSFYTRTVNNPEYAVKTISRKPGFTVGFMSAQDEDTPYLIPLEERSELFNSGRSWINVLRGTRNLGNGSHAGFIVTDRRLEGGGYGTILALDGNIRLSSKYAIDGQFLSSFTGEPDDAGASAYLEGVSVNEEKNTAVFDGESLKGNAFITRLRRFGRTWDFNLDYNQVDPDYRTLSGYDPWVNYRNLSMWNQITFRHDNGLLEQLSFGSFIDGRWLFDGTRRWEHQNVSMGANIRWAQTHASMWVQRGSETWTGRVSGQYIDYDDLITVGLNTSSRFSNLVGYNLQATRGRTVARFADAIGWQNSISIGVDLKPIDRLVIESELNHVRSAHTESGRELFRQFIARTRAQLQVNKELSVRLVLQHVDSKGSVHVADDANGPVYAGFGGKSWEVDPLITYRINSFSVLYAGSTHDYDYFDKSELYDSQWRMSARQYFIKLQYLFQV